MPRWCASAVVAGVLAGALSVSAGAQTTGIREVSATARSLVPLQTRLRYTTMIVLPDGEEILDVICGDKDFWVISATHNIAHVKPAKEGATTNLNLVAASGTVYSFLLTEKGGATLPDIKVYVNVDPSEQTGKPKYFSATQVEGLKTELDRGTGCRRGGRASGHRDDRQLPAAVSNAAAVRLWPGPLRKAVSGAFDLARRPVHLHQDGRVGVAGALRGEGREAVVAELPGARRYVCRAQGARRGLLVARQRALHVRAGTVSHGIGNASS